MSFKKVLYQSIIWRGLYYLAVLLLNILFARHYGAAVSGTVYYFISVYSLIILFAGLSLESGITFFTAKGEMNAGKLLNLSVVWSFITGLVTLIVYYYFVPDISQLPRDVVLFSVFTFICGNLLINYCTGLFYARNNFIIPNSINILINLTLVLLLPYQGSPFAALVTDHNYLYFYFGSFWLQGMILTIAVNIKYPEKMHFRLLSLRELQKLLAYCLIAYLSNLIFFFLYRIDYWFVKRFCTADDLGNYIQVSKIGQLFFVLPTILASAVFPLTAGGSRESIRDVLILLSRSLFWLYAAACLLLVVIGKPLFPLVFGKTFVKMYPAFLLLIPGILALSMLFTLTAYYAGKNKMSVNIKGALIALFFVSAGDYFLIPAYGIKAAALVSSVGYIIYLVYVLIVFAGDYTVSVNSFFKLRTGDFISLYRKIIKRRNPGNEV